MPAEAILAPGWTDRASLYFDLTEKAVGGLVRRSKIYGVKTLCPLKAIMVREFQRFGLNPMIRLETY